MTRAAEMARDEAVAEQVAAHPNAMARGLEVIEGWARTGQPFSSNDYRAELADAEVPSSLGGSLVLTAIRRGLIRKLPGEGVVSTDVGTHAKRIAEYIGTQVAQPPAHAEVVVPVQRDRGGKFTAPTIDDQPSLFGDL